MDPGLKGISLDTWKVKKRGGKTIYKTLERIEKECMRYLKQEDVRVELRRCAQLWIHCGAVEACCSYNQPWIQCAAVKAGYIYDPFRPRS